MSNAYNFIADNLQLSADKAAQFTAALATTGDATPLQTLCDEAAADVARLTTGYVIDTTSAFNFIRALAIYKAYTNSGTPVPSPVENSFKAVQLELQEISQGKRPNLPKAATTSQAGISGGSGGYGGGGVVIPGRIDPSSIPQ